MLSNEINPSQIAERIKQLELRVIASLIGDIAKSTKKKRLKSGTQSFNQFCETIALSLTKPSTKGLLEKYNL